MPRVRLVLVRPETAANVGACARVARNTGCAGLDLVAPGDWRTVECWRSAWGAHELLEEARVFPDLEAALAIGALPVANTDGYFEDWRALVQRTDLTPKEKKILEHLARKAIQRGAR